METMIDSSYVSHAAETALLQASLKSETQSDASQTDFKDLMSSMMLMSMLGSSEEGGTAGMNMLAPMLLMLMEKLIALEATQAGTATTGAADSNDSIPANASIPCGEPVKGAITQGCHSAHVALDFGIPEGTPIQTTMNGKVIHAGWNNEGYGNLVIVENGSYRTYYAHLSEFNVQVGDMIQSGSVVGLSGNTGNSTGPHLHYEIRKDGQRVDPTPYTFGDGET